jgi:hypothetical protein|tara:strand:+ start:544 stop:747 length:204 start_codon:yes stop_codon:yes gene_type:complete
MVNWLIGNEGNTLNDETPQNAAPKRRIRGRRRRVATLENSLINSEKRVQKMVNGQLMSLRVKRVVRN